MAVFRRSRNPDPTIDPSVAWRGDFPSFKAILAMGSGASDGLTGDQGRFLAAWRLDVRRGPAAGKAEVAHLFLLLGRLNLVTVTGRGRVVARRTAHPGDAMHCSCLPGPDGDWLVDLTWPDGSVDHLSTDSPAFADFLTVLDAFLRGESLDHLADG